MSRWFVHEKVGTCLSGYYELGSIGTYPPYDHQVFHAASNQHGCDIFQYLLSVFPARGCACAWGKHHNPSLPASASWLAVSVRENFPSMDRALTKIQPIENFVRQGNRHSNRFFFFLPAAGSRKRRLFSPGWWQQQSDNVDINVLKLRNT